MPTGKQPELKPPLDTSSHVVIDINESPPAFGPYQAEYFQSDDGDIVSHDHHLNEDGEALYRFLLSHSTTLPTCILYCSGTHTERRSRRVTRTVGDRTETHTEHYTVTITDFMFCIDLSNHIVTGPIHWSFPDSEPAYRGLMVRQVQRPEGRRKATKEEIEDFKSWKHERPSKGLPPWAGRDGKDGLDVLQSSQTLRQWADEYCASPKLLKEFVYEKFIHGWSMKALEDAIRNAIAETQYRGNVQVYFKLSGTKICIRPDNKLSRILSKTFVKFLLIIFLVYPFIWLFKRYNPRGGGRWEVCGGAYALKHVEPIGDTLPQGDIPSGTRPHAIPRIINTENGPMKIVGMREGEWFRKWEEVIKRSVVTGLERADPMVDVGDGPTDPARALDGY